MVLGFARRGLSRLVGRVLVCLERSSWWVVAGSIVPRRHSGREAPLKRLVAPWGSSVASASTMCWGIEVAAIRRVCLFGLGPTQKCPSRKSQARRFKSRFSCLGRRCRVWCGGVECARVHQLGPSWRSEQGFCRVRKRVVNIWSPIAPDNRQSDPGNWWDTCPASLVPSTACRA